MERVACSRSVLVPCIHSGFREKLRQKNKKHDKMEAKLEGGIQTVVVQILQPEVFWWCGLALFGKESDRQTQSSITCKHP